VPAPITTPLSSDYEVSIRMTPERVNRVQQAGQVHSDNASMSQRRTSGSVGNFFWRMHPYPIKECVRQEAEGKMVMQAAPGTALEVVET
jgi:hypothetical protein